MTNTQVTTCHFSQQLSHVVKHAITTNYSEVYKQLPIILRLTDNVMLQVFYNEIFFIDNIFHYITNGDNTDQLIIIEYG